MVFGDWSYELFGFVIGGTLVVNASGHGVEDLKVAPWVCDGVSKGWRTEKNKQKNYYKRERKCNI